VKEPRSPPSPLPRRPAGDTGDSLLSALRDGSSAPYQLRNCIENQETRYDFDMNGFGGIIEQLEAQKAAIERALQALCEVEGEVPGVSLPTAPIANDKRSAAQKARWAAKRAAEASPSAAPARAKGGMTPEGRRKLAEATKQRWAVKRTGTQAKRGPGRPRKLAAAA
jgi:hypothetical protein